MCENWYDWCDWQVPVDRSGNGTRQLYCCQMRSLVPVMNLVPKTDPVLEPNLALELNLVLEPNLALETNLA
jgi:hypothetical protein